jgi:hypothetical protein
MAKKDKSEQPAQPAQPTQHEVHATGAAEAAAGNAAAAAAPAKNGGQGSAVTLPNGVRRIDFIRDNYYSTDPANPLKGNRSAIRNAINEQLKAAGRDGEQIPYQIVFQATKSATDPRIKAPAAEAPAASAGEATKEAAQA